jgi:tetratricopeptide (TPR) repeat protein
MFWTWWQSDRLPQLEHSIRAIAAQAPSGYHMVGAALALLCCEIGQLDEARAELNQLATAGWERMTLDQTEGTTAAIVASVCHELGEAAHAAALYEHFRAYGGTAIVLRPPAAACFGPADHYLGLLALAIGDSELAERHFDEAVRLAERMAAIPHAAAARVELGQVQRSSPQPERHANGRDLLVAALTAAQAIGLSRVVRRATTALEET